MASVPAVLLLGFVNMAVVRTARLATSSVLMRWPPVLLATLPVLLLFSRRVSEIRRSC